MGTFPGFRLDCPPVPRPALVSALPLLRSTPALSNDRGFYDLSKGRRSARTVTDVRTTVE